MTERAMIARDGDVVIRLMRGDDDDFALLRRWRREPHVAEWWDTDEDRAAPEPIDAHYGPRTDPSDPTTACIIERDGRPIGYLQFYPWADYPEGMREMGFAADRGRFGLDILIGEPDAVGIGIGSRVVALCCTYLFDERDANAVALLTAVGNVRAQRAYEKAGLRKVGKVLDTDVRDGERVLSWLMVLDRPLR